LKYLLNGSADNGITDLGRPAVAWWVMEFAVEKPKLKFKFYYEQCT